MKRTVLCLLACLWASIAGLSGCSTNPATGKSQLTLLSVAEEQAIGDQAAPEFTAEYGGEVPSQPLQAYVDRIGRELVKHTEGDYPSRSWEFTLLNTGVVNAFALPGGKVFFTRGLAERLTNEAMMAGVLGHEVGHVVGRHSNERISNAMLIQGSLSVAAVLVDSSDNDTVRTTGAAAIPALNMGGQLVLLRYGRGDELEADYLGMRYMSKAGYNPIGQQQVMRVLADLSKGARQPEMLSSHPDPERRISEIQRYLDGEFAGTQSSPQHQLFQERYEKEFLSVVKKLPAPPASNAMLERLLLENPATWCAHCASAQTGAQSNARSGLQQD